MSELTKPPEENLEFPSNRNFKKITKVIMFIKYSFLKIVWGNKLLAILIVDTLLVVGYFTGVFTNSYSKNEQTYENLPKKTENSSIKDKKGGVYIQPFDVPNVNTSAWKTYNNSTHHYSLKYPPDWVLDDSEANNIEDYKDSTCCNVSTLIISKDTTTWSLALDLTYTGGPGNHIFYFDECHGTEQEPTLCNERYEGPIKLMGKYFYKEYGFVLSSNEVLYVNISQLDGGKLADLSKLNKDYFSIYPVFKLEPLNGSSYNRCASIDYEGTQLGENMEILDTITLSLQGLE